MLCESVNAVSAIHTVVVTTARAKHQNWVHASSDDFRGLVAEVVTDPSVASIANDWRKNDGLIDFQTIVAMSALAFTQTPPPFSLASALTLLIKEVVMAREAQGRPILIPQGNDWLRFREQPCFLPTQPLEDLVFDIAIAYGCCLWRRKGKAGWDGNWLYAMGALISRCELVAGAVLGMPPELAAFFATRMYHRLVELPKLLPLRPNTPLGLKYFGGTISVGVPDRRDVEIDPGKQWVIGDCHGGHITGAVESYIPSGGKVIFRAERSEAWIDIYWVGDRHQQMVKSIAIPASSCAAVEVDHGEEFPCACGRFECSRIHRLRNWDLREKTLTEALVLSMS